jgi:hypothetical protein
MVQAQIKERMKYGITKCKKEGVQKRRHWRMNKRTRTTNDGKLPQGVIVPGRSNIKGNILRLVIITLKSFS